MVQQNIIEDNFERPGSQEARHSKTEHTQGSEKEARLYLKQLIDDNLLESASSPLWHRVPQTKGSRELLSDVRSRRSRSTDCRGSPHCPNLRGKHLLQQPGEPPHAAEVHHLLSSRGALDLRLQPR